MDEIDKIILAMLKKNSRVSFNEISQSIGKTEATVRRRVKNLIEKRIIRKFTIDIDLKSKPKTFVIIKIALDLKDVKRIMSELREIEEITNIWRLSGDCGLMLKVEIASIEHLNPLIEEKISQITGIKIIETCFITDIIK